MGQKTLISLLLGVMLAVPLSGAQAEEPNEPVSGSYQVLQGEILDVEMEEGESEGAIYHIRDRESSQTDRFYADAQRTTVQIGSSIAKVTEVLGGSTGTMIYRRVPEHPMPELIYVKVNQSLVRDTSS